MCRPIALLAILIISINSCDIINPDEPSAGFIRVESIDLITDPETEGTDSENFSDVWAYSGGQLVGTFELPATFPIIANGPTEVQFYAGVLVNGISADRTQYGFMEPYIATIDIVEGETVTVSPEVRYLPEILTLDIIDFESPVEPILEVGNVDLDLEIIPTTVEDPDYLGTGIGRISLNDSITSFELLTALEMNLGIEDFIYLELDYKSTIDFVLGLRVTAPQLDQQSIGGLRSTEGADGDYEWRKIYIDIGSVIDFLPQGSNYELLIVGQNPEGEGVTFIDNIKVIYPQ